LRRRGWVVVLALAAQQAGAAEPEVLLEQVSRYYARLDRYDVALRVSVHGQDETVATHVLEALARRVRQLAPDSDI